MFATILIVEDDRPLAETLTLFFKRQGWSVAVVSSVADALVCLRQRSYDLMLVDRMLTDGDGLRVIEFADASRYPMKTLILSGNASVSERIVGLQAGASEYLAKPFSYQELKLKVGKLLLSDKRSTATNIRYRNITIQPDSNEVYVSGRLIHLRPKEVQVLLCLIRHQRQVVTRDMLIKHIWGELDKAPDFSSIDVYVRRVRMAMGTSEAQIVTKRTVGYSIE